MKRNFVYGGDIILTILHVYFKHFCVFLCMLQLAEVHRDGFLYSASSVFR